MKLIEKHSSGILIFIKFYFCVLLASAILAPLMFFCVREFSGHSPLLQHFLTKGFGKFFERARLFSIFLMLICFWKKLGVPKSVFGNIRWQIFWKIFFMGAMLVLAMSVYLMWRDEYIYKGGISFILLIKCLFSAAVIALLEEVIFRGVLWNLFRKDVSVFWATILTSIFFAYFHIRCNTPRLTNSEVTMLSGFWCAGYSLIGVFHNFNLQNFTNLFLLSAILVLLFVQNKSLWASIAFHAGAVFAIMVIRNFVKIIDSAGHGMNILDTWLTAGIEVLIIIYLLRLLNSRSVRFISGNFSEKI